MSDGIETTPVAVIGGGPIGLEIAVALRAAGVDYAHIEAGQIGSTIGWWAPATRFFSSPERIEIAGVPLASVDQTKATRERYLAYLRSVVRQFDLSVRTYQRVVRIDRDGDGFLLTMRPSGHGVGGPAEAHSATPTEGTATRLRADRVILAIGDMHRPRTLGVPGEDAPHVSHFFDDPHRYFGKRVLIVGGKNSAVEAAIRCYRCGAGVAMSYRGEAFDAKRVKYWLRPEIEWLIEKGRIGWFPRTVPRAIMPDRVVLAPADGDDGDASVPADFVLLLTGYAQDPTLFEQLGVTLRGEERAPAFDKATMETDVPGVYMAGTAVGGTQRRTRIFIENSHVHVARIVRALTGRAPAFACDAVYGLEES